MQTSCWYVGRWIDCQRKHRVAHLTLALLGSVAAGSVITHRKLLWHLMGNAPDGIVIEKLVEQRRLLRRCLI